MQRLSWILVLTLALMGPAAAEEAAEQFRAQPTAEISASRLFHDLSALVGEDPTLTLMLFDAGGEAVAWAGAGLVHEPAGGNALVDGASFEPGHTATTFFYAVSLHEERRPWRILAGRSLATDRLPFSAPGGEARWWLAPADAADPTDGGILRIEHGAGPALFVDFEFSTEERWQGGLEMLWQAGILLLALALALSPVLRLTERLRPGRASAAGLWHGLALVLGVAVLGYLPTVSPFATLALAMALGLALWGLAFPPGKGLPAGELLGAVVPLGLVALAVLYERGPGRVDLGASLGGSWEVLALRLSFGLSALGLFGLCAASRRTQIHRAEVPAVLLFAAAALHDFPSLALPLLAVAGFTLVRWLRSSPWRRRATPLGVFLLLAATTAACAWEVADRVHLRYRLAELDLPQLAPPTDAELNDLLLDLEEFFAGRDLEERLSISATLATQDLAFVLWRESPLAQRDALSALVIEPKEGEASSFAFGLALDENLELIPEPERWRVPAAPAWRRALLFGEAQLTVRGEAWGWARYSLLPRPGFRLPVSEVDELEATLVRGKAQGRVLDGLPRPVLYGLYEPTGEAIESPWDEAPPLDADFLAHAESSARLETPSGDVWAVKREEEDGIEVLFLPFLGPQAGLERVGVHALGTLWMVAILAALALPLVLPGAALARALQRMVSSYSQRLILVYTVLLLVPLIALNLILLQSFEDRLRQEQLANAQAAIGSARHFLLDYLHGLKPGFGIDTQVNRPLLEWISSVVQHQVNLYWGSRVFASSQQELFTAGLSPRRIPGEIFSRLALEGYDLDSRTRQTGALVYQELYAPLEAPGLGLGQQGLFLSVPLLEQEEEVGRELAALRRRAVLVTTALFLLLMAAGSRLARSFTKPIMELIDGTRSIAGGADRLAAHPREHELSALATAIDEMARRIAEGRRKLLYEKQLVETIVDHITSGVLLLDAGGRTLLLNRVAADLLGASPGTSLETLRGDERLGPVTEFLETVGEEPRQDTVRLTDASGESRDWTLSWVPLAGTEDPAAILVVDDDTEVLRGQRLEAWAEMARIIAHEIKNPLTPIQLSTEHLQQVWRSDPEGFDAVFERCTDNILRQVEELRDLASDFSIYSRIPRAELVGGDLVEVLSEVTAGYRDAARAGGVEIEFEAAVATLEMRFDRKLLGRAVRNLLENALRANAGRGRVAVRVERLETEAVIRVEDGGPGVEATMLGRIFEPYFSTYETGTGLGLAITRRVVEEHGGSIEARNRSAGGLEVVMRLPLWTVPQGTRDVRGREVEE